MTKSTLAIIACALVCAGASAQTSPNQQDQQTQDPQDPNSQDQNPVQNPQGEQSTTQPSTQPQTRPAPIRPGAVAPMRPTKIAPVKPATSVPIRPSIGHGVASVTTTRRDIDVPFSPHQNTRSFYAGKGNPDADGDGNYAIQYHEISETGDVISGGDCDDGNSNRFPGNTEIPDFDGNDEDCDPATIGDLDRDGDGHIDYRVWNADFDYVGREKRGVYGDDCDDTNRYVNPGTPEIPGNGIDDNCDGDIDHHRSWRVPPPE